MKAFDCKSEAKVVLQRLHRKNTKILSFARITTTGKHITKMDDDHSVDQAGAGASDTFPEQCSKLRKGGYVMIKDKPCKVMEMSTSKTGKHGHAKVHYVGLDIFTGKKYEDICPSTHSVNVPHVNRSELQIIDVDEGYLTIMDDKAETREIPYPDKYTCQQIKDMCDAADEKGDEACLAVIWKAVGEEKVLDIKTCKSK